MTLGEATRQYQCVLEQWRILEGELDLQAADEAVKELELARAEMEIRWLEATASTSN